MKGFPELPAPSAERRPERIEQLGRVRVDPYAWLKDPAWQAVMREPERLEPGIRAHLEAENRYARAMLEPLDGLAEALYAEMRGRIREDDASPPHRDGAFLYWTRYREGGQHPLFMRRPAAGGPETVLLDGDAAAAGKAFFSIGDAEHTADHRLFAYAADEAGAEFHTLHILDAATGAPAAAPIENTEAGFVFSADGGTIFFVRRDENARPSRVFRRPVDGAAGDERLIYEEPDEGMFVHLGMTQSRRFVVISTGDHETSAALVVDAADPQADPRWIEPRTPGLIYGVEDWDGAFVIRTNADGATDFKVVGAPHAAPGRANWRDLVPHRPGRFVIALAPLAGHLVRVERSDANQRIVVRDLGGAEREIGFEEPAYALGLDVGYAFETRSLRFVFQSPRTPRTWIEEDLETGTRTILKVQEVPSGHDPDAYEVRRLHAPAHDGESVPVTVLMRRGAALDGSAPLFLYGYGAYGLSMDPVFSIRSLSLVDRGFIHAIAHVRGGSEKGWSWFLQGRGPKKPNTFRDFLSAVHALVAGGYGARGRIVACGGSAGGLLMGAAANLEPELFCGVIAAVPFVDVLNTMSDPTLPLTPPEWPEWGNPLEDPDAYDAIAAYSPYDNIAPRPYPPILATGGLTDPRVTYWEPAKWIARLRAEGGSSAPAILKLNMDAGHQGASGRFEQLKETALEWAFALRAAGLA